MKKQFALIVTISFLCSAAPTIYAHESDEKAVSSHSAARAERADNMRMQHERMRARHEGRMANYLANKVDTDQDGVVTYDEFMANAKTRFEASDLNDDGAITNDERKEAAEIMRKKHREAMRDAKESRKAEIESRINEERETKAADSK